ncbi:MAG: glycosyltransferase [Saprospiraceae bacterium]
MKIIIIGPAFPLRGGIATFDEMLCKTFTQLGHECQIVSYSLQYPSFLFPGKTQYDEKSEPPVDITIHTKLNSINPISWFQTARFIRLQKPELIIFRYWIPFMGPALGTIRRLLRDKNIYSIALVDNLIPHEKRFGDRFLNQYFMKGIQKYLVMSEEVKKDVLSLKNDAEVLLLRHPIYNNYGHSVPKEEARTHLNLSQTQNIILFFGLIRRYKGLDLLLEAMANFSNSDQIILVVAGEFYEDKNHYFELVKKLNIEDKVRWFDQYIPNEEVKFFFSAANILALPYRTATQSGVTQVAFHFNTPVLVTDVGGLGEIIHHDEIGYVAKPNPTSIFHFLKHYFKNEKESEFRLKMEIEKKKYDWDKFAAKLINFAVSQKSK